MFKKASAERELFEDAPEIKAKLEEGGSLVMGLSPDEFTALLKGDLERVGKIVKSLGIKVDEP